jgi:hypothetical protein
MLVLHFGLHRIVTGFHRALTIECFELLDNFSAILFFGMKHVWDKATIKESFAKIINSTIH